jgi:iron complex outermembrane recepter protein
VKKDNVRDRLFATTVLAGLAMTGFAHAQAPVQTTQPAEPAAEEEEAIIVTGSRIVRQDFTAISPVTTVGAQDIELTATLSVEQLLNELPSVIPGNTITSNNAGGEDFATIDLRGLGTQRTLVIVDGERVTGSSTTGVVDLNTIPAGLIDRIEVVTGGASAVYGSDAIAGVVNFILRKDYEGAQVTATVGASEDGNAQESNVDFLWGGNFADGKGNMTIYGSWYNREGVMQSAYPYSAVSGALMCAPADPNCDRLVIVDSIEEWNANIANGSLGGINGPGGSATSPWGQISNSVTNPFTGLNTNVATAPRFTNVDTDCNPATAGVNVTGGTLSFNQQGQLVPYRTSGFNACAVPGRTNDPGTSSRFNFAPDNFLIIPAERFGITASGSYKMANDVDMEMLLTYVKSEAIVQLAPTPITGLSIPVTSPLIPADLAAALASRPTPGANFTMAWRSSQLGGRVGLFTNNAFNSRVSFAGELPFGWDWKLNLGYGESEFIGQLRNNVNRTALLQGLTGCANIPASARLPGCTNVSIFGPNALTPTMANFIRLNTTERGVYSQTLVGGYMRGDLPFGLPAGNISAVVGFEYRDDEGFFRVDDAQRTGNIFGFNATQDAGGSRDVYEGYAEVAVPILADLPFAHFLGVEFGYRYSDYSTIGGVSAYKVGGEYSPFTWLKFRTVYNEAVRAPSILELFQNGDQGFPSYVEPCRDTNATVGTLSQSPALQAFCISQGVAAPLLDNFAANNTQVQAFAFGNPALKEETAETLTFGVVFEPDFLPIGDLKVSIDYYDIKIADVVATRGAGTILNSCYGGLNAANPDCARIVRDPATGQIVSVNTSIANLAALETDGIDVQIEYAFDLDEVLKGAPGRLRTNVLYSYVDRYGFQSAPGNAFGEFQGTNDGGIGGAIFDWRTVLTVNYDVNDWTFQARWSYTPELRSANFSPQELPAADYLDVSARWDVTDNFRVTVVAENVFDEQPEQIPDGYFGQANTDTQLYRVLGRTWNVSARLKF